MQEEFRVIMEIRGKKYTEERALFHQNDLVLFDCVFEKGESPLKESTGITAQSCLFRYKYPFWYGKNIKILNSTLFEMARAGIWYTDNVEVIDTVITAPKNFRRCKGVYMQNVTFTDAKETLWNCRDIEMTNVTVNGDYFGMNCENIKAYDLRLNGNYGFDGCKNVEIRHSHLLTKDAFWNCENVYVSESLISGEYLGWNTKNLTLENCTLESLQGLCYVENLKLINCNLFNTTLSFEYSKNIDARIKGCVDSILNPGSGYIEAEHIGELIYTPGEADPAATEIVCDNIDKRSEEITW